MGASQRFVSLDSWLAWLETLHPKKIDFSLNRIRAVLDALALAAPPYRVITIGGTNGKGSCVAILESVYLHAGYSVGAFTSPHLWRFNERIRLNGKEASDDALVELFEIIEAARGPVTLSYFEYSAVAAMLHFARCKVDVALLEVGMGGRLDAVNAYDADAAAIVSIDIDHQEWLGQDRDAIGREKAGIIRKQRPVVIADSDPPASVLREIDAVGAHGYLIGRDFDGAASGEYFNYEATGQPARLLPRPPFGGEAQVANAAACVTVVDCLQEFLPVDSNALASGLSRARISGRIERRVVNGVEWIFDVAHNPAAASYFKRAWQDMPVVNTTLAVFAAMKDKNLADLLGPFVSGVDEWFLAPTESERSQTPEAVSEILGALAAGSVAQYQDVAAACADARSRAVPGDRVLVFGSFYTVGPAMAALELYFAPLSQG